EALARNGMKFTQANACTVCTPSRVSLITGNSPARHHVTTWTDPRNAADTGEKESAHDLLPPADWSKGGVDAKDPTLLPKLFRDAGYRTILVGKAHFGPLSEASGTPENIGFEVNIGGSGIGAPGSYRGEDEFNGDRPDHQVPGLESYHGKDIFLTEALTREMKREIKRSMDEKKPFFAYMSHYAVHSPFKHADPKYAGNYPDLSPAERVFATLVEGVDASLRDLLAFLDQSGVAENTLVVFVGDNGTDAPIALGKDGVGPTAPLRGKKGFPYEGGIRVPLIVSWAKPDASNEVQRQLPIAAGSSESDLVTIWDLYPTLAGAAGLKIPDSIEGCDLRPYLKGDGAYHRPQEFFLNFPHSHQYQDFYALLKTDGWKAIHRYASGEYELYDLASDPSEQINLADKPEHRERLMKMAKVMKEKAGDSTASVPRDRLKPDRPPVPIRLPE
ncbi:MAG TPA: sulfatase-like hydrolase/transferase, partial [Luteolibacter sp.]|nr:sulfatase-like hydrolase/transferase [Luteolibacter sp.]